MPDRFSTAASNTPSSGPAKVMIVDDSVVIRGLFGRWIDEDPELTVVATHRNGQLAVDDIERTDPDIVVLDVEMPVMDGLTALPLLLAKKRGLVVIMASTLTRRNAEVSLKALSLGATEYVAKPESTSQTTTSLEFRHELLQKLRSLGEQVRRTRKPDASAPAPAPRRMRAETSAGQVASSGLRGGTSDRIDTRKEMQKARAQASGAKEGINLRPYSSAVPRILAVGSSTGGPQALQTMLKAAGASLKKVPVVITQHMPRTFTTILAEHIGRATGLPSKEAADGEVLQPGHIYVAPGGLHMRLAKADGQVVAKLDDGEPINFCKPAVDPLFESVAEIFGAASLAVVLTGMGSDGAKGTEFIAHKGGSVIAQDEATSVVWGMPGAAVKTGSCSSVLPLDQIGPKVMRIFEGTAR
ncbi:chemotaxis response regulator protein-glutamate methylesterase [Pseudovibrio exalbescens]|uniref:protein-glutamate methylesterase/protein-glutamine glutaminase n=1 Tax=Pseudovibrio exalbescens TaxID=197461 RepID=UPI00236712E5|nr:chemotaxis response regulator protein-glutamate methylesterase [Pseudovibrio exalbescens]MDD7911945.1 chemotaxis response regulator protein-glutamate methylesterase [Pseudovibrio exalbescens]